MNATGKYIIVPGPQRDYIVFNQRCRAWQHPYEYQRNGSTLANAGCGVFSVCHAAQYLSGKTPDPEALADFSCQNGGRGDDGTDRPALLAAMERAGLALKYGFSYAMDGLRNDTDALYARLRMGDGALCNLRPGHIVALIGAREADGEKQVLAIDSYSESADAKVIQQVRQVLPGSEIVSAVRGPGGAVCGMQITYALYWAALSTVRDFNLLTRLRPNAAAT